MVPENQNFSNSEVENYLWLLGIITSSEARCLSACLRPGKGFLCYFVEVKSQGTMELPWWSNG